MEIIGLILTIIGLIVGGILIFGGMFGAVQDGIDSFKNADTRKHRWLCRECDKWYVGEDGLMLWNYYDDDNPDPDKTTVNNKNSKYPSKKCARLMNEIDDEIGDFDLVRCPGEVVYKGKR